jgi:transcriptional regulator GlxA family with amidase domain
MTPFEYLNDVKLKRAMYLMRVTSNSVEEISLECGFNNYSHFYRLFIRKNGLSPSKWREMIQMDPLSV